MYNIIMDWLSISDLHVSDDIVALIVSVLSLAILLFLLDFLKMIYYTVSKR